MNGINTISQSGSSYLDQVKQLQRDNMPEKTTGGKQKLAQEDFLSLLTKQLAQQDPFKPVENDQMISQMASFSTVEGISNMGKQFETLNSSMASNQALQASSLVGRDVLIQGSEGVKQANGGITAMITLPQKADEMTVRITDESGQLVRTLNVGPQAPGSTKVAWDGLDDNGKLLPPGKYKMAANGILGGKSSNLDVSTYANVNSVLLGKGDGNVLLNLAGFEGPVKLAEVLEVGKA